MTTILLHHEHIADAPSSDETRVGWVGAAPLLVLTAAALVLGRALEPWVWMWCIAGALFAGSKWLTWWAARPQRRAAGTARSLAYLLAWPGMDAPTFLAGTAAAPPRCHEWLAAATRTALGAGLLWAGVRIVAAASPLVAGWLGMIALFWLLHIGLFRLLSLWWRRRGVDAPALFDRPTAARCLAEFWGRRWNVAFRQIAHVGVFRPLIRRVGPAAATLAVFVASGLAHELVISVPARGGWGLPTAYFALQGVALLAERSRRGRAGDRRAAGRVWTLLIAGAPALALFHPRFIAEVVLPFLGAIGAV